ncbi:hypothetical protein FHX57_003819 [Paraburkholderia tropica]|uniref:replication endonuclease n=2 Tax=Paraburkholderia tropica TaxID=92647 RepID=UPI001612F113|nr:replication endonuclease [Paraburkholderia tropica]MBB3001462.1 hypothetical protein [Paraburkholderia tropica]
MWVYAHAAERTIEKTSAMGRAQKRLPLRWLRRARKAAFDAGRASARRANAPHMFDVGASVAALDAFVDDHAPETMPVTPDASDFQVCDKARRIANDVQNRTAFLSSNDALVVAAQACATNGINLPKFEKASDVVVRVRCELWWRRQLRRLHIRSLEHSNIRLHYVHYQSDPYASDDAVRRRLAQNRRNAATLAAVTLENEEGQRYTLEQLAALGMANKALRRGEMMTRLRGCEVLADAAGFAGVMFTLTCPSRFHAVRQLGGRIKWIPNKKHDANLTPRDAQRYLRGVWARIRAQLRREGVTFFGMRVAEPHHDSTPHWHGLVFSNNVERFCSIMRAHGMKDSATERGAHERRVRFERIDRAKGSAVGYIAKYIAKNIDGAHVGEHKTSEGFVVQADLLNDDEITPSQRVEAWAATWGIRQFQQFGGAPVGVWRELRRVKAEDLPTEEESPAIRAAWAACQKTETHRADWAEYARAMGGIAGEARMIYVKRVAEMREGRYGISPVKVPHGVAATGIARLSIGICNYSVETEIFVPATRHEWKVVQRSGKAASTRTCVNNCTRPVAEPVFDHHAATPIDANFDGAALNFAGGGAIRTDRRPE